MVIKVWFALVGAKSVLFLFLNDELILCIRRTLKEVERFSTVLSTLRDKYKIELLHFHISTSFLISVQQKITSNENTSL